MIHVLGFYAVGIVAVVIFCASDVLPKALSVICVICGCLSPALCYGHVGQLSFAFGFARISHDCSQNAPLRHW